MDRLSSLNLSPQTRARFDALVEEAPDLGINPNAVAAAGLPGLKALLALKQAHESSRKTGRERHLGELQNAIATLRHRKHPELANQFQARAMALQGRGSDTEVAHVARGEIVVPVQLQTPDVLGALRAAAMLHGVPVDMLRVGNALNHINPATGAPEFGVMDWISGLFGKSQNPGNSTQDDPAERVRIVQSPYSPCDPRYIEELENAKDIAREFPHENNPILRGINAAAEAISGAIHRRRPPPPPSPFGPPGGRRG